MKIVIMMIKSAKTKQDTTNLHLSFDLDKSACIPGVSIGRGLSSRFNPRCDDVFLEKTPSINKIRGRWQDQTDLREKSI